MNMTKRQRYIIEMLMDTNREMTIAEIAEALAVSSRTVQRDIGEIEIVLHKLGIALSKKAGTGIMLRANGEQIEHLKRCIGQFGITAFTPEERRVLVICRLLAQNEPVKLFTLSHDLMAAVPTISNDLDDLEPWLRKNRLELVRKRGYGVAVLGSEIDRRRSIFLLANDYLDDSLLFSGNREADADPVSRELLGLVGPKHFDRIEQALWKLDEKFPTKLGETEYTQLLVELSIAANRFDQGSVVGPGEMSGSEWRASDELKSVYRCYAELMNLELPPQEERYVMKLLGKWLEPGGADLGLLRSDLQELDLVVRWIRGVENRLSIDLSHDPELKEGLLLHIRPVLEKIRRGDPVRNPLLQLVRKDYAELYEVVSAVVRETAQGLNFPDEEIAYLVMHFGAALERLSQRSARVRALLVCTSGIGSTRLLAARIEKEIPEIELLNHISWYEASRVPRTDYDLVISTVDLPLGADQYIKLSPLLTAAEVEKLRRFIERLGITTKNPRAKRQGAEPHLLEQMSMIGKDLQTASRLIETFHIYAIPAEEAKGRRLPELVVFMCDKIGRRHGIRHIEPIAERLLLREKRGTQVLGDSGLALFHTRHEAVLHPVVGLFRFGVPVSWPESGWRKVRQILLMLGPEELDAATLEILSEFSAMLLEPGVIGRLEHDDEASLKVFFADHFESLIKNKWNWRETNGDFDQGKNQTARRSPR